MTFAEEFWRLLAEETERMERQLGETFDGMTSTDLPTITVTKSAGYLMLSVDQQLDAGLITEEQARAQGWTPYVAPPIPWYRRLRWRWRWQAWRERAGRKVGGWIAGVDLSERGRGLVTDTSALVAFFKARLDEDERYARAAFPGPWRYNPDKMWNLPDQHFGEEFIGAGPLDRPVCVAATGDADDPQSMADAAFIARHDPARVLREVEGKRKLLAYLVALEDKALDGNWWNLDTELPLKLLAVAWADHPDYRREFAP